MVLAFDPEGNTYATEKKDYGKKSYVARCTSDSGNN